MPLEDDLKARTSALISQQMANWVVEIQRAIQGHQAALVRALDELGETVARYDEKIDEADIATAISEVLQQSAGAGGAAGGVDYSGLKGAIAAVSRGSNLSEVLTHLVDEVGRFVDRAAIFITKSNSAVGWYASGVDHPDTVKLIGIPLNADTLFRAAVGSRHAQRAHTSQSPGTAQALARLGGHPQGLLAVPIILRDKVAAILYCDTAAPEVPPSAADATEILVAFASKVIDVLSAVPRAGTGTHPGFSPGTSPGMRAPSLAPPAPPAPPPPPAPPAAADGDAASTVMFGPSTVRPRPAPPVRSPTGAMGRVAAPSATPAPPAAQRAALSPEDQKAHDDARRFARLVVSEIKLYNEAKVAEGRKTKDIYERLKEDIERGRQMYNDRVNPQVRETTDYFQDELVRILAGGDAGALGRH
jgi:hypothetical protein